MYPKTNSKKLYEKWRLIAAYTVIILRTSRIVNKKCETVDEVSNHKFLLVNIITYKKSLLLTSAIAAMVDQFLQSVKPQVHER